MTDDTTLSSSEENVDWDALVNDVPAKAAPAPAAREPSAAAAASSEGGSSAMLRGAIQKVMDEIEHHEREAKRHLQQAEELRKELRSSISFLQAGGGPTGKSAEPAKAAKPAEPAAKTKAPASPKKSGGKRK
jgi:hypothetical protein